jgi:hypothetical protein
MTDLTGLEQNSISAYGFQTPYVVMRRSQQEAWMWERTTDCVILTWKSAHDTLTFDADSIRQL